ncbi:MAG: hypothetical protein EOM11_06860 [Erysipelotrichia bacterium]|nr:hypothetical protein [Erysipelotrichia bacterium]
MVKRCSSWGLIAIGFGFLLLFDIGKGRFENINIQIAFNFIVLISSLLAFFFSIKKDKMNIANMNNQQRLLLIFSVVSSIILILIFFIKFVI